MDKKFLANSQTNISINVVFHVDSFDLETNMKQSTNLQQLTLQAPTVLFQATVGVSWRIKKSHADATCKCLTPADFSITETMGLGGER